MNKTSSNYSFICMLLKNSHGQGSWTL
jgi:hypothetical protein